MENKNSGDSTQQGLGAKPAALVTKGRHGEILNTLLGDVTKINFRSFFNLSEENKLHDKHFMIAVAKRVIAVVEKSNWKMRKTHDDIHIYDHGFWKECSREDLRIFLREAAIKSGVQEDIASYCSFTEKLLKQFRSELSQMNDSVDADTIKINLQNCTFYFTNNGMIMRQFDPDDAFTYQLPFAFDPDAQCPLFDKYLLKVLPDESCRMLLQEHFGSIFTKKNFDKIVLLVGGGDNGKSVLFETAKGLFASKLLDYSLDSFLKENNVAQLQGKLLNYADEKSEVPPDLLKRLISGKSLRGRHLYQESFSMTSMPKVFSNCNKFLLLTEDSWAFIRRIDIIPFLIRILPEECDRDLSNKIIKSELAGIFNWMLAGRERLLKNNAFTYCKLSQDTLKEFTSSIADPIKMWVEEKMKPVNLALPTKQKKTLADLYRNYEDYCLQGRYRPIVNKYKFSSALSSLGYEKTNITTGPNSVKNATAFFIEWL